MPGDFDFDDEPVRRRDRDDDDETPPQAYGGPGRRVAGRVKVSVGALACATGGLLALISLLLPAGWGDTTVNDVVSSRVWFWALGSIAVGVAGCRVREVENPALGEWMLAGLNVIGGLVFALFLALIGYLVIDNTGLKGIGIWFFLLSALLIAGGSVLRLVEQLLWWHKGEGSTGRRRDDDRPRRRPARREEVEPAPKGKKPEQRKKEDEERPKAAKRTAPARDEASRPKSKPAAKPPLEDLPDE